MSLCRIDWNRENKCEEDYIKCSWGGACGRTEGQVCIYEKCKRKSWRLRKWRGWRKGTESERSRSALWMQFKELIVTHTVRYIIFKRYSNLLIIDEFVFFLLSRLLKLHVDVQTCFCFFPPWKTGCHMSFEVTNVWLNSHNLIFCFSPSIFIKTFKHGVGVPDILQS